jgi:hypothetical protein
MDTTANTRHLTNVSPAQVEAMRALDHDTLSGLVLMVRMLTQDEDVREHATIIVASLFNGANNGEHAARAAVRIARRAVTASRALRAEDMYGDLTEEVVTSAYDADVRTSLTRYAPDPASGPMTATTYGDLVTTVCGIVGDPILETAARTYARHAADCTSCTGADSHRVTLAGVIQHVDGMESTCAEFHSMRRAVLRALRAVPAFSEVCERIGDPAPLARAHEAQGSVSHGTARKESTRDQLAPVRTVTHNGTPRAMTDAETTALRIERERQARYAGEEYRGGTHGPSEHDRSETTGMVRSFAVSPSPRKRARTGSTGPTVPTF